MASRLGSWRVLSACSLTAGASFGIAATREVDTRRFPRLVRMFLLPEEAALLKGLKDDKDRVVFQQLFWARRDPSPGTPANEFEDLVRPTWKGADDLFSYLEPEGIRDRLRAGARPARPAGGDLGQGDIPRPPSVSVCGTAAQAARAGTQPLRRAGQFDNMAYLREGSTREPETWVYRDRPGLPYTFTGAELEHLARLRVPLRRGGRHPGRGPAARGGGLRHPPRHRLRTAAATGTSCRPPRRERGAAARERCRAAPAAPRTDFPLAAETKLSLRGPKGEAYVAGLVQARPARRGRPCASRSPRRPRREPAARRQRRAGSAGSRRGGRLARRVRRLSLKPGPTR